MIDNAVAAELGHAPFAVPLHQCPGTFETRVRCSLEFRAALAVPARLP